MDFDDWRQRGREYIEVGRFPSGRLKSVRLPGGWLRAALLVVVLLVIVRMTYYQVSADEVGVVQRFGRYVRTTDPGAHFKIPVAESVRLVPIQRQLKAEFGFRTARADVRSEYVQNDETQLESLMLTGDLNVAVVEWIVQYKVKEPYNYLFKVRTLDGVEGPTTFRDMNEAVMRAVVGDQSVNEVLTIGREQIQVDAKGLLQKLCDAYETGIDVQQIVLQDVNPPDAVKPSFNEVNQAIQERERLINEAYAEYTQEIPRARGEAEQAIRSAEGYSLQRVNNASGDVSRFVQVYDEYRKAPEVTRQRLYLETLNEMLPRAGRKVIIDERSRGILPLLDLGQRVQEVKK
jgi:membrane protease subunit HflK